MNLYSKCLANKFAMSGKDPMAFFISQPMILWGRVMRIEPVQ